MQVENELLLTQPALVSSHQASAYLLIDLKYPKLLRRKYPFDRIEFTYMPEEISESGGDPSWNEVEIMGRFAPYSVYGSNSSQEISLNLAFFAHNDCISDVKMKVDFIRGIKYPVIHEGITYRPPALLFVVGDFINRRVLLTAADVTYKSPWYLSSNNDGTQTRYSLFPMQAEVSLTLRYVPEEFMSGPDIMRGLY